MSRGLLGTSISRLVHLKLFSKSYIYHWCFFYLRISFCYRVNVMKRQGGSHPTEWNSVPFFSAASFRVGRKWFSWGMGNGSSSADHAKGTLSGPNSFKNIWILIWCTYLINHLFEYWFMFVNMLRGLCENLRANYSPSWFGWCESIRALNSLLV